MSTKFGRAKVVIFIGLEILVFLIVLYFSHEYKEEEIIYAPPKKVFKENLSTNKEALSFRGFNDVEIVDVMFTAKCEECGSDMECDWSFVSNQGQAYCRGCDEYYE